MATMLKIPVSQADHILGPEDPPVTLLEYGDYECPHCGIAHPIVKALREQFGDRLRFVFRNFPLTQIHPLAGPAAEAAEFAASRGQFWEMHDAIYENQLPLSIPMLLDLGEGLGLPGDGLLSAIENHEFDHKIREDFMGGVKSGVNGTPTFFINGVRHEGSFDLEVLSDAIQSALSRSPGRHVA